MSFIALLQFIATLSAGLFAGAALYVTFVEHPARLQCGTALAVREFGPSYRRATVLQVLLAAVGVLTALLSWWMSSEAGWLLGGILLGAVVPFSLIVVFPVNHKILHPSLDKNSEEALALLRSWGRLHAIRSALGLGSFLVFLGGLLS